MAEKEQTRIRVLLIEDDEDDYILFRDMLRSTMGVHFEVDWVVSAAAARTRLEEDGYDVIVTDNILAGERGTDFIRNYRQSGGTLPCILLTGYGNEQVDSEAMEAGAHDYMEKAHIEPERLTRTLRYLSTIHAMEQRLKRYELRDPSTGLPGPMLFPELVADLFRNSVDLRQCWLLGIVRIKEESGASPDEGALERVAQGVADLLQADPLVESAGRISAGEFGFVAAPQSACSDKSASLLMRIEQGVEQLMGEGGDRGLSFQIGVDNRTPDRKDGAMDGRALIQVAGSAFREPSENCLCFSNPEKSRLYREQLSRLGDIADALDLEKPESRLVIHYQPIVDLKTLKLVGFEALARLQKGDALFSPAEFIPLAEMSGHIDEVGKVILREGCQQLLGLSRLHSGTELTMNINVSPLQLQSLSLMDDVKSECLVHGIAPEWVCLEFTEHYLHDLSPTNIEEMEKIGRIGVRLSADDFGEGETSLAYLGMLPLNEVKFDMIFSTKLLESERMRSIVQGMNSAFHSVGMTTILEGVETVEMMQIAQRVGFDRAQGFLFSHPLPPHEAERLVERGGDFSAILEDQEGGAL